MKHFSHRILVLAIAVCTEFACSQAFAAVTTLDLQVINDPPDSSMYSGTTDGGAGFIVTNEDIGSSGSGLINSFLRVQSSGNEQGFNHDRTTAIFDEGPSQTDSLLIEETSTFNIGGTEYGEFLLDTNDPLVSLNQLQIFAVTSGIATDPNLTPTNITQQQGQNVVTTDANGFPIVEFGDNPLTDADGIVEVFRLSDFTNQYEILVPSSGSGSGTYDMRLFFEWNAVASLGSEFTHFIVYSQFGNPPGSEGSQSGFEEWSTARDDLQSVPEPGAWALLLMSACGALFVQYRRQRKLQLAAADTSISN